MVANRMARDSFVGPSHAAISGLSPHASSRCIAISRHNRVVDQQPEGDDETCDSDLPADLP